jgi:hypothetical protein
MEAIRKWKISNSTFKKETIDDWENIEIPAKKKLSNQVT